MQLTTNKRKQLIAERLKIERERLGYTEQQIAQLLGYTLQIYQGIERGEEDIPSSKLPRLFDIGMDILFILTEERHIPGLEEEILVKRFRKLSRRGRISVFNTIDALEKLDPGLTNL